VSKDGAVATNDPSLDSAREWASGARLAVLIDSDNTTATLTTELLEELAKYGALTVKRAYGDWTTQQLAGWKDQLHRHAIQPVQQFAYTTGKNSTDSALIIDAMDLLYSGNLDGFAIVSSDSDFTRLATRLRESGKTVYGMGRRTTPAAFVAACDRFIYLDVLTREPVKPAVDGASGVQQPDLQQLLVKAVGETSKEDGWSNLGDVGSYIGRNIASFDPRNYGYPKLGELVRAQKYVELKEIAGPTGFNQLWVRIRKTRKRAPAKKASAKTGVPKNAS